MGNERKATGEYVLARCLFATMHIFMNTSDCCFRYRDAAGSSLIGVTALCPLARHINLSLVLVQPRETRPYVTKIVDWT